MLVDDISAFIIQKWECPYYYPSELDIKILLIQKTTVEPLKLAKSEPKCWASRCQRFEFHHQRQHISVVEKKMKPTINVNLMVDWWNWKIQNAKIKLWSRREGSENKRYKLRVFMKLIDSIKLMFFYYNSCQTSDITKRKKRTLGLNYIKMLISHHFWQASCPSLYFRVSNDFPRYLLPVAHIMKALIIFAFSLLEYYSPSESLCFQSFSRSAARRRFLQTNTGSFTQVRGRIDKISS